MFIYPLAYLLMWIFPFINHCYGYTNTQAPFGINSLAVASVTLQCAADCIIFEFREKPWKHMKAPAMGSLIQEYVCSRRKDRDETVKQLPSVSENNAFADGPRKSRHWWDIESLTISNDGIADGGQLTKEAV